MKIIEESVCTRVVKEPSRKFTVTLFYRNYPSIYLYLPCLDAFFAKCLSCESACACRPSPGTVNLRKGSLTALSCTENGPGRGNCKLGLMRTSIYLITLNSRHPTPPPGPASKQCNIHDKIIITT